MDVMTIVVAIVAFLVVTLLLVALLLFAKAKLTSSGNVTIDINDGERVIETESGSTLLSTLANHQVFLPSACGGGGSCGMCKCQVMEGGGEILPTETGFINRKMAKDHWRLGCQVKVKEDMKIRVPESVLGVKKWECEVISNRNISIDEFFDYSFGILPYRSVRFDFVEYAQEFFQPVACVNYPCNYDFTRIGEYKHFLNDKSDKTVISFEYSSAFELGKNERCYPISHPENAELYKQYRDKAQKKFPNVHFLGRLGDYKYYDMDKAVARALALTERESA